MSRFSFGFMSEIDRHLHVDGAPAVDIGLTEAGYLYLVPSERAAMLREIHEVQRAEGADVVLLTPDELAARFPWLAVDGVALGSLGVRGEGWFDGFGLLQAFRRKAISLGADYVATEAVGMRPGGGRLKAVDLADGTSLVAATVVNAAGPWARGVAAMAGVALPVEARRRTVFVFDARRTLPGCPLVIDTSGTWFRPEGDYFLTEVSPAAEEDLDGLPLVVDPRPFEGSIWPALAARVPAFEAIKLIRAWAGYYEVNTFDRNAILGAHPEIANLYFANGFSGHGIQQSPAVGRAIAELIVYGRYVSLDLSVFGFERIAAGRAVVERNVIG